MLKQIERWQQDGLIEDIVLHFARAVAKWGADIDGSSARQTDPAVLLGACLVMYLSCEGHVCADLQALAAQPLPWDEACVAPAFDAWRESLRAHPAVGEAAAQTPLVLDGHRLYLRRHFEDEGIVAASYALRKKKLRGIDEAPLLEFFPPDERDRPRDQRKATAAALRRQTTLISGGPGTGKTTTLAAILALELMRDAHLRIALAAPTGKAAARMQAAVRGAKMRLPIPVDVAAAMPDSALTLHRLLGAYPADGGMAWRYDKNNPLPLDLLVVDEASMIDLNLMARLCEALPPEARLILLGDRDQLASVDAGAVFADLCSVGAELLSESFRFIDGGAIAQLATAIRRGDGETTVRLLHANPVALKWHAEAAPELMLTSLAEGYAAYLEALRQGADAETLFQQLARFCVLTPQRNGPCGVAGLNAGIERELAARGLIAAPQRSAARWYAGRPVMISSNDYGLGLFNGDLGICVADRPSGELSVCFLGEQGARRLPPARVPAHETAWAMTVHKAQGSESDRLALVLPPEPIALLTRELLYTAVTRARHRVAIWGREDVIKSACAKRIMRYSGLAERLLSNKVSS